MNFIIKTHRKDTQYNKPCLFILNKGLNSGKPQQEPFTNSFVIIFEKQEDAENIYFVAYSLWKSKFWHQFLIGSVIPFLRIKDIEKEFYKRVQLVCNEFEDHKKNIAALKLLEEQENHFNKNLKLINDIRNVIIYKYSKNIN
jgi:hypothetical protein